MRAACGRGRGTSACGSNRPEFPVIDLRLLLVTDGSGDRSRIEAVAGEARRGGAVGIQVREPRLSGRALLDLARALRTPFPPGKGLLLVNDRLDVALASGADGVQLGWRSFDPRSARSLLGPGRLLGVSTHSLEEVRAAEGADFLIFGPIHETPSKRGLLPARGIEGIRRAVSATSLPVVAIGGIDPPRARECARAGASGVACIGAFFSARDPEAAARDLLASFEEGRR